MKRYAPAYYPRFACLADRCRHSCCIGWEIEVDEENGWTVRTKDRKPSAQWEIQVVVTEDGAEVISW